MIEKEKEKKAKEKQKLADNTITLTGDERR